MRPKLLGRQPARVRQYHRPELTITHEHEHIESLSRLTRSQLDHNGLERAARAVVDSNVCAETHNAEQTVPWVVGKVMSAEHRAAADSPVFEEGRHTIRFDSFRAGDFVLVVRLWEALEPSSSTFTLLDIDVLVAARRVRVLNVTLEESLQVSGSQRTQRFVIAPDSLQQIRAEMPVADDEWEADAVLQHRTYHRQEQWLIRWKGNGKDRNTWEPLAHLNDAVQSDAQRVTACFLAAKTVKDARQSQGTRVRSE